MDEDPRPPKPVRFKSDGTPDGRGHADGSKPTRFYKGDGRTRKGRPKGAISLKKAYAKAVALPVYSKDGKQRWSTLEGIALRQREKALKGDDRATKRFEDRISAYFPEEANAFRMGDLLAEDLEILRAAEARGIIQAEPAQPEAPPLPEQGTTVGEPGPDSLDTGSGS